MTYEEFLREFQKKAVEEYPNRVVQSVPSPVVSVRVSTYRHVNFIRQCLDGILGQVTTFPFEVCIGEDDSDDGTREVCLQIAREHPDKVRLFLHHRANCITVYGRKTGKFQAFYTQAHCRGRYVALCDGDDFWTDPHKLQKQVECLDRHTEFSQCFTNYSLTNESGVVLQEDGLGPSRSRNLTHEDILSRQTPQPLTAMFRRDAIPHDMPQEFFEALNGDLFLAGLFSRQGGACYLPEVTGCYRQHAAGIYSSKSQTEQRLMLLHTTLKMRQHFRRPEEQLALRRRATPLGMAILAERLKTYDLRGAAQLLSELAADGWDLPLRVSAKALSSLLRTETHGPERNEGAA